MRNNGQGAAVKCVIGEMREGRPDKRSHRSLSDPFVMLAALVISYWPVWLWYWARMTDGADEPWGVLALLTLAVLLYRNCTPAPLSSAQLAVSLSFLVLYISLYHIAPPLIRAGVALLSIAPLASSLVGSKGIELSAVGMLVLSLPLISSLQFYAGYPVRLLSSHISAAVISLFWENIVPLGVNLYWRGETVSVDAPCSGIKMLWSGLFFAFSLALAFKLTNIKTWRLYILSGCLIFLANAARISILFFVESKILPAPAWMHTGVGLILFAGVCIGIYLEAAIFARKRGVSK